MLADKAATLPGLKAKLAKLQKDKSESEGASKEELASLIANTKEQSEKLEVADKDLFKMKSVVQELRCDLSVSGFACVRRERERVGEKKGGQAYEQGSFKQAKKALYPI